MEWVLLVLGAGLAVLPIPIAAALRRSQDGAPVPLVVKGFPEGLSAATRLDPAAPIEVATGDPGLDRAVTLRGEVGRWLRYATPEVRAGVRRLLARGFELRDGSLRGAVAPQDVPSARAEALALRAAFTAAPSGVVERFSAEADASVRRRLLDWALGGHAEAAVLALAATDPDAGVRFRAAEVRGDGDALAELVTDPATPLAVRDHAFTTLRGRLGIDALADLLVAIRGPGAALARERLTSLPPGPWVDALVEGVLQRATDDDPLPTLLALLHGLPEGEGRARVPRLVGGLPEPIARALVPKIPIRLLSQEVLAASERAAPALGPLLRSIGAERRRAGEGLDLRDADLLFEGTGLRWQPMEGVAVGTRGSRVVQVAPAAFGSWFRMRSAPRSARLSLVVGPGGERSSEVPGTAPSLSWFPPHVRDLVRDDLPPCDLLQVEDGEVRLRAQPWSPADVERAVSFLERLADALDALAVLSEAERVTAAFRAAEQGPVRRKLAGWAFAADPTLAADGLADEDPEVRRAAGRHAPHPPTLVALVSDPSVPVAIRAGSLGDLQALGDRDALSDAVGRAWHEDGLVVHALAATRDARLREQWPSIAALVGRLAPPAGPARLLDQDLVREALFVLCALEEPASELTVLRATASRDPALRRAAIGALGAIGSPRMLRALQACAEHHPSDRPAVDQAIARLRARVGTGSLAIASAAGGGLSVPGGGGTLAEAGPQGSGGPGGLSEDG